MLAVVDLKHGSVPPVPASWEQTAPSRAPSSVSSGSAAESGACSLAVVPFGAVPQNMWPQFPIFDLSMDIVDDSPKTPIAKPSREAASTEKWTLVLEAVAPDHHDTSAVEMALPETADDLVASVLETPPLNAGHQGVTKNVKKHKLNKSTTTKRKAAVSKRNAACSKDSHFSSGPKMDSKNIHSRAWHGARKEALSRGLDADAAKDKSKANPTVPNLHIHFVLHIIFMTWCSAHTPLV